jgi:hypothetical protein
MMKTKIFHLAFSAPSGNFVRSLNLSRYAKTSMMFGSRDLFGDFAKHVSFSKVDAITLLQVGIKTGPLFLAPETRLSAEGLGSTEVDGKSLTMEVLKQMISLVRRHVSVVVSEFVQSLSICSKPLSQTEAGCRVLINLILLRVASTMSTNHMDVNIIPEFPITKTVFPGNRSFGGVVDFLLTKLPEKYTGADWNCRLGFGVLIPFRISTRRSYWDAR